MHNSDNQHSSQRVSTIPMLVVSRQSREREHALFAVAITMSISKENLTIAQADVLEM